MKKIRWGILSTAKIGTEKVIPAMQRGSYCEVTAIACRDMERAQAAACKLGIPKSYGSGALPSPKKTALAVKPCTKFFPPTGPSSPAAKKPARGMSPRYSWIKWTS
jgi:hypothetical protein